MKEQSHLLNSTTKEIILYENFEIINLLILKGIINNIQNKKNKTSLHYAAKKNLKEIGEILISKGADINAIDIIYLNMIILFLIIIIEN